MTIRVIGKLTFNLIHFVCVYYTNTACLRVVYNIHIHMYVENRVEFNSKIRSSGECECTWGRRIAGKRS